MKNTAFFENNLITLSYIGKALLVDYKKRSIIDLKAAKKVVQEREKFTNNTPTLVIADFSKIDYVTTEARTFFAGSSDRKKIVATAIIFSSKIQEVMGNIYIKFNKPKSPVKLFTRLSDAQEWLLTFTPAV